jgi:hypothetical protein
MRCKACNKCMSVDEMCNKHPITNGYEELCFVCLAISNPPSRRMMSSEVYHLIPEEDYVDELCEIFFDNELEGVEQYRGDGEEDE